MMNSTSLLRITHRFRRFNSLRTISLTNGFTLNYQENNFVHKRKKIKCYSNGQHFHTSKSFRDIKTVDVPPFAESVTEGDVKWLKKEGDVVAEDDLVAEIETDKTTVPVPSPYAGKIVKLLVEDSGKVNAKQGIFKIDTDAAEKSSDKRKSEKSSDKPKEEKTSKDESSGEIKTINVPPFAESVTEGDIRWLKNVGDTVQTDELIAEIETDKTTVPVPAPSSGKLVELLVKDGSKVTADQKILKMVLVSSDKIKSEKEESPKKADPPVASKPQSTPATSPGAKIKTVKPKSVESLKVKHDSAAIGVMSGNRGEERVKMNRMRLRIAQRLKDSQNTCAMLTTFNEIDMSNLIEMRNSYKDLFLKQHGVKLGIMSAFTKAAAYSLMEQPVVNAVIDSTDIVYRDYVDISIAVATPKGLVVPVLRNCETMNYLAIERGIAELGEKAKKGQLTIEDMDNGTFTISNGGVFGSLFGTPIINPPQSAILGMHATFERPVVRNGEIVIRPMMYVALTYDHRLIDGREAVTFLRKIKSFVEDPRIFLLGL